LADRVIANLPPTNRPHPGVELIEAVIKAALPSINCPSKDLPLVDAFAKHHKQMDAWFWGGMSRRPKGSSCG
jgi:hypothetical protein